MIKKYLPLIVFVIIVLIPTEAKKQLLARVLDSRQAEGYVAFVVNETTKEAEEDQVTKCECGGTRQLTHGDGHKTPCPCDPCDCVKVASDAGSCPCGCSEENCGCSEKKSTELPSEPTVAEPIETIADRYAILKFTATWCGPCQTWDRQEAPKLEAKNITIERYDYDSPGNKKAIQSLRITSLPTIVIIDKKTRIPLSTLGYSNGDDIYRVIEKLDSEAKK